MYYFIPIKETQSKTKIKLIIFNGGNCSLIQKSNKTS